jgi:hypothetical protein
MIHTGNNSHLIDHTHRPSISCVIQASGDIEIQAGGVLEINGRIQALGNVTINADHLFLRSVEVQLRDRGVRTITDNSTHQFTQNSGLD